MADRHSQFVLCVKSDEDSDVLVRKVYEVLPDETAAGRGYLRVVDESGEDYLYPSAYFVTIQLPQEAEQAFEAIGTIATTSVRQS